MRHGISRADCLAIVAGASVLGCLGVSLALADPSGRAERLSESLANLRAIGAAMGEYRADHAGSTPFEGTTSNRRVRPGSTLRGVCGWQFGGKNPDIHWYSAIGGVFDVEAADRPLNSYLYPDYTYFAPASPERLAANDPNRASQQARVFRDPADISGRQRNWPNPNNPALSSYDDVGTSYLFNMGWLGQFGVLSDQLLRTVTTRLATDRGVDPARFVHVFDNTADIAVNQTDPNYRITGNHGGDNAGMALFADGHAGLVTFRPGATRATMITPEYSVWFEDIGRPSGLARKAVPGDSR